jgi:hypothetical protein
VTANWAPWWVPKWAMSMSESTCSYMRMYASLPTTVYSTRAGNRMSWYAAGNQCVTPIASNTESRNQSLWLDATTPFIMMVPPSVNGLYTPCFTTVAPCRCASPRTRLRLCLSPQLAPTFGLQSRCPLRVCAKPLTLASPTHAHNVSFQSPPWPGTLFI